MMLRHLVSLVMSASLLHLSVGAGDAACATHGADNVVANAAGAHAMPAGMPDMPAMHGASAHASSDMPSAGTSDERCETPVRQHCCEAQAGCSVSGAIVGARHLLPAPLAYGADVHAASHDAPAPFASPPEPPPPKA